MRKSRRVRKLLLGVVAFAVVGALGVAASHHSTAHWYAPSPSTASGSGGHWSNLA